LKRLHSLVLVGLFLGFARVEASSSATVQRLRRQGKIMLAEEVKRGMVGTAKSVFVGTKIETFRIEILGVLRKEIAGGDVILFRCLDGPVVQRKSGIVGGMSGSPVYINGKLIGAIAYGWAFPREPIGGISPISQMIESTEQLWRSDEPNQAKTAKLSEPLRVAGRTVSSVRIDPAVKSRLRPEAPGELLLRPVALPIMVSGFRQRSYQRLKTLFEEFNFEPVMGGGSAPQGTKSPKIEPGAVAALEFARGDLAMAGGGTITYVDGDRVWAFGHPFMETGPSEFPLSSGYVVDFFPSLLRSDKFIAAIAPVGTIRADALHAIGGTLGKAPPFIPMTVTVCDRATGLKRKFESQIVDSRQLTPRLVTTIGADAMESIYSQQLERTVRVSLRVEAEGVTPIERSNLLFSRGPSTGAGLLDLTEAISILQDGEQRAKLKRVELTTELLPQRRSARLKRMFVDKARVKVGEEVEVGVVLEPLKGEGVAWTETFKLRVPKDSPAGIMRLGAASGRIELTLQSRLGATVTIPEDLKDLVDFYQTLHNNNDLVIKAALPRVGVLVDERKLPMTPLGLLNVMTRARSTTIGTFRDLITLSRTTDWSIAGNSMHMISVQVESKRRGPEGIFGPPPPGFGIGGPGGSVGGNPGPPPSSVDEDDLKFETLVRRDVVRDWRKLAAWSRQQADYLTALDYAEQGGPTGRVPTEVVTGGGSPFPSTGGPGRGDGSIPGFGNRPMPSEGARGTGRPNRSWVQTTDTDFLAGTFTDAAITSRGEVVLAPQAQTLFAGEQPLVLAVTTDAKGTVYAGTGNDGKVFALTPGGKPKLALETKDLTVTALAADAVGNVFAGSAPSGRIWKVAPDGKTTVLVETKASYVWALTVEPSGGLLAATGLPAQVLRIAADGKATVVAEFAQEHARAMALDRAGTTYVGTGEEGVLYRLDRTGPTALYNSTDGEITALTVAVNDDVYFGTSANGTIWRRDRASGEVEAAYRSPQQGIYALCATPDGSVYAGTGDRGIVYRVFDGRHVARALEPVQGQATALALDRSGRLLVGMANGATVYALGLPNATSGSYDSPVLDAQVAAGWLFVRWQATEANGAYATLQTRSGNTREPEATWSAWSEAYADANGSAVTSPPGRFLQYRVALIAGSKGESPVCSRVEVVYRTRNQPPQFLLTTAPPQGAEWSGSKLLSWQGRDPDSDVLTYRVCLQADGATEWKLAGDTRATSYSVDTTKFADGPYRVKLTVSDDASNPDDALSYEEIYKPLVIDNTPPVVTFTLDGAKPDAEGRLKLTGSAKDERSRIASVDYRLDAGDSVAALPTTGAFEALEEKFHFTTPPLKGKPIVIEVRVKDAAGNITIAKQTYTPTEGKKDGPRP